MIPSLSGSLYKFDGENLDRIPFTVDSLLKSSFRYNDDLIISGMIQIN
jgi:translation initiation factor 2-alpha kinase 3